MYNGLEREFDDEVYEDEYYEEHFDEEELFDEDHAARGDDLDSDLLDDEEMDEGWDDDNPNRKVETSYACDDCDYRWDDVVVKRKNALEDDDFERDIICPMCGSQNISII